MLETESGDDLVPLAPLATNAALDEHMLVLHIVAFVAVGTIPRNASGQKMRALLRFAFVRGAITPFFVNYNI